MSGSRTSPFRGQETARPRQMGLLLDMSLDGDADPGGSEEELEAELMSLMGEGEVSGKKGKRAVPVPMADIERMAALCMKDLDEEERGDEEGDLEDDADLLAELNEVLVEDKVEKATPTQHSNSTVRGVGSLESRLLERIDMYQTAIGNANAAKETSKARRYERGLKTLQSMLSSARMGKVVNEDEIPPPVATGGRPTPAHQTAEPIIEREQPRRHGSPAPSTNENLRQETPPTIHKQLRPPQSLVKISAMKTDVPPASPSNRIQKDCNASGSVAVEKQFSAQPPTLLHAAPPVANSAVPAPHSLAEALQQRMQRYKTAAEDAKTKGDDRKARMHLRIVKQYQGAIQAHKAGRPVSLSELPIPPGCPPLQDLESGEQSFSGVLEAAMKLANQDADEEEGEEQREEVPKVLVKAVSHRAKAPAPPSPKLRAPGTPLAPGQGSAMGSKAQQQLDFLLARRQQFVRAALRSKHMNDMQGAALHLRHAKGLDHMITAAKGGLPVDITKMCLRFSQQFTHMGNVAETVRFEKLAEECMNNIEVLRQAHGKGYPVPNFHTEERTFSTVKIIPDLTNRASPKAMDTSVRFEFPFPSSEEAQKDKTSTVKNTNCPEFKEQFKLNISRGHRSLKRVIQSRGIKFEIIRKGGLFKTDKVVGSAQLKLDSLEKECEIRQLIEVLDGRKPTGGHLEVVVKIREPLGGPQVHKVTERWLVLDPLTMPTIISLHSPLTSVQPQQNRPDPPPSPFNRANTGPLSAPWTH
ncbi:hypothetical protein JZ751_021519 [Albula glossodonta]|uniref:C2 domain-containing protein n=1 Tax=Albula glossodonta TaxID=121402 RepID=A0A8T2NL57_9TELE|nr:hypothetical protein JZ751_021519 [Albula glossodonta]